MSEALSIEELEEMSRVVEVVNCVVKKHGLRVCLVRVANAREEGNDQTGIQVLTRR